MANDYEYPGSGDSPELDIRKLDASTEYLKIMIPPVIEVYSELGLDPKFAAILGRHLEDLKMEFTAGSETSTLSLYARKPESGVVEWYRKAEISSAQVRKYQDILTGGYKAIIATQASADSVLQPTPTVEQDFIHSDDRKLEVVKTTLSKDSLLDITLHKLAVDWVFFELTADVAGNSCYMQRKYDRYISDYNGQSDHFRADLAISNSYLTTVSEVRVSRRASEMDHLDFKAGISLVLMHDAILRSGLLTSAAQARLLVMQLRQSYVDATNGDMTPHSQWDLANRLTSIQPRNIREGLAAYLLALEPSEDEEE